MSEEIEEKQIDENETAEQSNQNKELSEIESLKEQLQSEKDKFIRLFAEFDNYKKRTSKERIDLFKRANQEVMIVLLPILDDFERAMAEITKSKDNELTKGIELIQNKLIETLIGKGLKKMEVNQGDDFDTDKHEAITQVPAPSDELKNKIIDITEPGYTLNESTIRFAKVVVGA